MKKLAAICMLGLGLYVSLPARIPRASAGGRDGAAAWKSIGPDGGAARALVINPAEPGGVYAVSSGSPYRIFRSVNGGTSWKRAALLPGAIGDLALAPENPSVMYGPGLDSVYKSLNKGASWTRLGLGKYNYCNQGRILTVAGNPGLLFVTGGRVYEPTPNWRVCMAVFRSTDGGATWTVTPFQANTSFGHMEYIAGCASRPQFLFAAGYGQGASVSQVNYVFRSADLGLTWAKIAEPSSQVTGLVVHPSDPDRVWYASAGGVFRTTNGGASWERNAGELAAITALTLDRDNPLALYAGAVGNCYRSLDGGIAWTEAAAPPVGMGLTLLAGGKTVLFGGLAGIYRSTDGGSVFKASQAGFLASDISVLAAAPSSPATMYAESLYTGLFRSANGGTTWKALPGFLRSELVRQIAVEPSNAKRLFVLAGGWTCDAVIYRSVDGGMTWRSLKTEEDMYGLAVAPSDPRILYAAGRVAGGTSSMGVYISRNGGTTWTSKRICPVPGSNATAVAVDPRNTKLVFLGGHRNFSAALFRSANGGASWTDVTRTIQGEVILIRFDPLVAGRVYAVTSTGAYKTTNGGASWDRLRAEFDKHALAFHPTKKNTLYMGGFDGVFISADGGAAWKAMNSGLAVKNVECLAFNPATKVLYAGTFGGGAFRIQQ